MTKLAGALEHKFLNKESATPPANWSGSTYISADFRNQPQRRKTQKIRIAPVQTCGHQNRICLACAYSWGWDYQLNFQRTGGGRTFQAQLEKIGLDPQAIANGTAKKPE
jgi:hypothetical protein